MIGCKPLLQIIIKFLIPAAAKRSHTIPNQLVNEASKENFITRWLPMLPVVPLSP